MNSIEELIQLATRRLRPDAELQLEIAHELRAHLEDAIESARAEGASEEEAQRLALERFGDPQELSDKLWQANHRRMRLRAVARWAFRAAVLPSAVLLAILLNWQGLGFVQYMGMWNDSSILSSTLLHISNVGHARVSFRTDLSPEKKAVLGIFNGNWDYVAAADQLVALFPDSPIFQANRVSEFLNELQREKRPCAPQLIARGLEFMDAGERVEPDNAFYNYMKAALLTGHQLGMGPNGDGNVRGSRTDARIGAALGTCSNQGALPGSRVIVPERRLSRWIVNMLRPSPNLRSYNATVRRSMAPVWVGCLIVLGLVALGPLRIAERHQSEKMYRSVMSLWNNEVGSTSAADYQTYLRNLPDKGKL